jgi:hypothetical protein
MRIVIVVLAMLVAFSCAHSYQELIEQHKKPAIESVVNSLLGNFKKEDVVDIVGGEAYDIARTGVGCAAGFFGGLDTGFTIADIIRQDPTDFETYIFAVLFIIAWWQQNGQYLEYMCINFWRLIHH